MSVFGAYAHYYDLLYQHKDYAAESRFVDGLLRRHGDDATRVLDLGCGTGAHAVELAALGHAVHGIDRSSDMLAAAERRRAGLASPHRERILFTRGDATSLRLGCVFDAVVALFHVMSYLTSRQDFAAGLATARAHLRRGGLLLFDFWNGAAVEAEPPEVRTKRAANDALSISRLATPTLLPKHQLVRVQYDLTIVTREQPLPTRISEVHEVRYMFVDEIAPLLLEAGFDVVMCGAWMTEAPPGPKDWSGYVLARA